MTIILRPKSTLYAFFFNSGHSGSEESETENV